MSVARTLSRSTVALLTALAVAVAGPAHAEGAETRTWEVTEHFEYVSIDARSCIGEAALLEGTLRYLFHETRTSGGGYLTQGHTASDLTATGLTSGTLYQVLDTRQIITNRTPSGGFVGTGTWVLTYVGAGDGPNWVLTAHERYRTQPGTDEVEVTRTFQSRCVG